MLSSWTESITGERPQKIRPNQACQPQALGSGRDKVSTMERDPAGRVLKGASPREASFPLCWLQGHPSPAAPPPLHIQPSCSSQTPAWLSRPLAQAKQAAGLQLMCCSTPSCPPRPCTQTMPASAILESQRWWVRLWPKKKIENKYVFALRPDRKACALNQVLWKGPEEVKKEDYNKNRISKTLHIVNKDQSIRFQSYN